MAMSCIQISVAAVLVSVMCAATGITPGDYLRGVRYVKGGAVTNSVVMRSATRTVRFIEAHHRFDRTPEY